MAKGDSSSPKTDQQSSGFTPSQTPQQNGTLSGNPSTDNQAQTRWMNPSDTIQNTGINGGNQQTPQQQPIQNGTMLGQITAGTQGQYMPGGYDQGKFNDPNKHDPKYDIGRILSKYPPGSAGLQSAAPELAAAGWSVIGKDTIRNNQTGDTEDVGKAFGSGDPNQMQWQWSGDLSNSGQQGSMLGANGNNPQSQNDFLNQMFQMMQARRNNFANQQFNPVGNQTGNVQISGTPYANNGPIQQPMFANQPQSPINFNYQNPNQTGPMQYQTMLNPQPGQMVPNGWGGMKPYDPNFTGIS